MDSLAALLVIGLFLLGLVFTMRMFGAWMFRIDDVIRELKEIKSHLANSSNDDLSV